MLYFFVLFLPKFTGKNTRKKSQERETGSQQQGTSVPRITHDHDRGWTLSRRKQAIVVLVIFIRPSGMLEFLIQFVRYGSPFPCVCLLRYIVLTIIYLLFNIGVNMTSGSLSVAKRDCNLNASNNFRKTCRYMLVTTFCLFLVRLL